MARMGKEGMMNSAAESQPKSGHRPPAAAGKSRSASYVGNETKADMRGAMDGNSTDGSPLRGAMRELHSQHPHSYDDLGPHHGTTNHIRHKR